MNHQTTKQSLIPRLYRWLVWGLGICLILLTACEVSDRPVDPATLKSRYQDEQPALSGDGRLLAFVSNRSGSSQILLYDLEHQQFISSINPQGAVFDSPSLSRTGRYLTYVSSPQGRPEIFLLDRITQRSEVLTHGYRSLLRNPHISADGRYIVFETARRGQWDIEVLDRGQRIELDIPDGSPIDAPQP